MKQIAFACALALAACTPPAPAPTPAPPQPVAIDAPSGVYRLDPNHASLIVRATHFGMSHYTLRLTKFDATLNFDAEHPTQSSITATADPHSVQTDYPGTRNFDAELQNSQWLDADTFPELRFQSTSIELTGANTGRMTGDLTIRGVTKPVTFDVTFNHGYAQHPTGAPGAYLGFSAHGTFKRSDYGMMVLQPPAGAPTIGVSDEAELVIEAEFTNQAPSSSAVN
jgi:polyisoprenoid-binding protein YceI